MLSAGFLLLLLAGPFLISLALNHSSIQPRLLALMHRAFGRPVEVNRFSVSLLGGLRIEANNVTVADDPRFGNEFFLRAERITASLRWQALLRGRLEFGNLSLLRPSLNLVRDADGRWNILAWLPVSDPASPPPAGSGPLPKLYRIEVDTGRVNFKTGYDKHPFALVEVNGNFSQGGGGWQTDFEALAFRAGAMTQEPGQIRVRGTLGGAQSRILPADLLITWDEASVADVSRLLRGTDLGVRGELAAELQIRARTEGQPATAKWSFKGSARVEGLHGRELPSRASDPALNLRLEADWHPAQSRVELKSSLLETAQSSVRASGEVVWEGGAASSSTIRLISSGIDFSDALAFYRAFREGVSSQAQLKGSTGLDAELAGWPLQVKSLLMASAGGTLAIPGTQNPIRIGRATIRFDPRRRRIELSPVPLTLAAEIPERAQRFVVTPASMRFEGAFDAQGAWRGEWRLTGQAGSVKTLEDAGAALGLYSIRTWQSAGWSLDGPADIKLTWQTTMFPLTTEPSGSIEVRRATLTSTILPEPVSCAVLRMDFGSPLKLTLADAQAFGGRWSGTIVEEGRQAWSLALSSLRLDTVAFDKGLSATGDANPKGLEVAIQPVGRIASIARLHGRIALLPQIALPLLQPLRPGNVSLDLILDLAAQRGLRVSGSLAAAEVATPAPVISQR